LNSLYYIEFLSYGRIRGYIYDGNITTIDSINTYTPNNC